MSYDDARPGPTSGPTARQSIAGSETRTRLEQVDEATDRQRLLAGRYRLESLLGRGSMGAVWKARDVVLGRAVAVKEVLLPETQTDDENEIARERALREARSIAALSHPNVVTLFDVVEDDGRPWVVMELVPAKSLAQIIKDDGTLPPSEAARIGLAVLAALGSAHEVGITHRDVKPGNILVSPDGRVKLADFGISRRSDDSQLTRTGLMVGSPSYIAPEVARGRPAGPPSDIWGLGATLQCAVEGAPPFDLGDPVATLTAVVGDPPAPAPHAGPLQPVLSRMLEKDPRVRIGAADLRVALEQIAAQRPGPRPTYAPPTGPLAPLAAREPAAHPTSQQHVVPRPPTGGPYPRTAYTLPAPPHAVTATGMHGATSTGMHVPARYPAPASAATPVKPRRSRWIPALVGLLVLALVAGGVWWVLSSRDDKRSGEPKASASATASASEPTTSAQPQPTDPPSENNTVIDGTTASGAIKVAGEFRPFSFELPTGWEVAASDPNRSEFQLASAGSDPEQMMKVTVVAATRTSGSVDDQIQSERTKQGSPAMLPNFSEIQYEVTSQGNVLWQYTNTYQGAERRGYFFAADKGSDVLWKVITSCPLDAGGKAAEIANTVIKTFQT